MPFEEQTLKRTLLIVRQGTAPNVTYRLHAYMREMTQEGQVYLVPLPSGDISLAHQGLLFTSIEYIDPPRSGQYSDGDLFLTRDSNDAVIRMTAVT